MRLILLTDLQGTPAAFVHVFYSLSTRTRQKSPPVKDDLWDHVSWLEFSRSAPEVERPRRRGQKKIQRRRNFSDAIFLFLSLSVEQLNWPCPQPTSESTLLGLYLLHKHNRDGLSIDQPATWIYRRLCVVFAVLLVVVVVMIPLQVVRST